ncbi:hypothetical protein ABES02_29765 [Neobacillus pocheonensis]|uniref:DUF5983 family protein n=1 Tax=Neobacillus pocheonensis TaxID=363869 RepID=UPI003D2C8726
MSENHIPIVQMLTISTGHISEETNKLLLDHGPDDPLAMLPIVFYQKSGYGFFIVVPDDPEDPDMYNMEGVPDDLRAVLVYARENLCSWVMLDRDADFIEDLPSYDW